MYDETQEQFGVRIGYSQAWISEMEKGKKPIPKTLNDLLEYMINEKNGEEQ